MDLRWAFALLVAFAAGIAAVGGVFWYFAVPLSDAVRGVIAGFALALLPQAAALLLGEVRATRDRRNTLADEAERHDRDRADTIAERLRQDDLERVRQTREWAFAGIDASFAVIDERNDAAAEQAARARVLIDASPAIFGSTDLHAEWEAVFTAVRRAREAGLLERRPANAALRERLTLTAMALRDELAAALDRQRTLAQRAEPLHAEPAPAADRVLSRIQELLNPT